MHATLLAPFLWPFQVFQLEDGLVQQCQVFSSPVLDLSFDMEFSRLHMEGLRICPVCLERSGLLGDQAMLSLEGIERFGTEVLLLFTCTHVSRGRKYTVFEV